MRKISTNPACWEFVTFIYALTDIDQFHSENDGSRAADLRKQKADVSRVNWNFKPVPMTRFSSGDRTEQTD